MEPRNTLDTIYQSLINTDDKSLFGIVSPIHLLSHPPVPLNTAEMHSVSGEIIRKAKHEVLLEFYKFTVDSDGGNEIISALKFLKNRVDTEKKKINVCILVNETITEKICKNTPTIDLNELSNSEYFNIKLTLHSTVALGFLNTKMIIIDSELAMIRGGDPDAINDLSREQFETATLLRGSIVAKMRCDYNDVWYAYCSENLLDIPFVDTDIYPEALQQIPCVFFSKRENGNPFSPYYYYAKSPYKIALLKAISEATTSVHIITSNLNDNDICMALVKACKKGICVSIITGKHHNDSTESWNGGTNFKSMAYLVSQVPLCDQHNLEIRWATKTNGDIVYQGDNCSIHAKYVCIDNELVFVGSSPLDQLSMLYSREADIIFSDKTTAKIFDLKFFIEKFNKGKDYFEEAYYKIRNQIELQTNRIGNKADTEIKIDKHLRLQEILKVISTEKHSLRIKLNFLIEQTLPIFQIPTGNIPGMPTSYNAVVKKISEYGLDKHFNIQVSQQEKKQLINRYHLIPSSSPSHPVRKRAASDITPTPPDHDEADNLDMRKSR